MSKVLTMKSVQNNTNEEKLKADGMIIVRFLVKSETIKSKFFHKHNHNKNKIIVEKEN